MARTGEQASGGFDPLRLHFMSEKAWAVVSHETGAIALDDESRLIMRLTEGEARRIAREMTEAAAEPPAPGQP